MGIETGINLDNLISVGNKLSTRYPTNYDSFILKAGKCSDLHIPPDHQIKLG